MPLATHTPSCPICKQGKTRHYRTKHACDVHKCSNCGVLFVWPQPEIIDIYEEDYFTGATRGYGYSSYESDKTAMVPTFKRYLSLLSYYAYHAGTLLDVGAATGLFVRLAKERGWNAHGIDISHFAVQEAQKKGIPVHQGTLTSIPHAYKNIDAITLWDVFEHIRDPHKDLKVIHSLLAPNGLLALNTPDAASLTARLLGPRWHLIIPPEHLFLFTKRALTLLLEKNGFSVIYTGRIGKSFAPSYILSILYGWTKLKALKDIEHRVSGSVVNRIHIPLHLRDNVLFIARKI